MWRLSNLRSPHTQVRFYRVPPAEFGRAFDPMRPCGEGRMPPEPVIVTLRRFDLAGGPRSVTENFPEPLRGAPNHTFRAATACRKFLKRTPLATAQCRDRNIATGTKSRPPAPKRLPLGQERLRYHLFKTRPKPRRKDQLSSTFALTRRLFAARQASCIAAERGLITRRTIHHESDHVCTDGKNRSVY